MVAAIIRIGLVLVAWSTIFFIPKNKFKKYMPVATFAALLVLIEALLSTPFKWWSVKGGPLKKALNELSFIFGPFFVGTIWIFNLTFGKFWSYLLTNLGMDLFLAYPANWVFQKLKVYKLVNFRAKHIFFSAFSFALVIYFYQMYLTRPKFKDEAV